VPRQPRRGLHEQQVFVTRLDGHLVALDAKTGKELWKTQVVDYKQGAAITSPPTIVKNLVITGFASGEQGVRGYIAAFDQETGKERCGFGTSYISDIAGIQV
jgi:alcohol dehydrogenase (cytochrome c)